MRKIQIKFLKLATKILMACVNGLEKEINTSKKVKKEIKTAKNKVSKPSKRIARRASRAARRLGV